MSIRRFMPDINRPTDFKKAFARARRLARAETRSPVGFSCRSVAIVLPDREVALQYTLSSGSAEPRLVHMAESILPSAPSCNVVGVALNEFKSLTPQNLAEGIPFLGLLLGLAYIGHNVVVFEGHPSAFSEGVSDADFLLVDAAMIPSLQGNWLDVAFARMRRFEVYVYQADGQLLNITKATQ